MPEKALLEQWLRGPRLKVDRANQHIIELKAKAEVFLARNPYRAVVEENLEATRDKWPRALVLRVREETPEEFSAIIGDIIHNLRSALDLLVCALVRANEGDDKNVKFPIAKDASVFENAIKESKIARGGSVAMDYVRALKPYGGEDGNWPISSLHALDIEDKHRLIITVGGAFDPARPIIGQQWSSIRW